MCDSIRVFMKFTVLLMLLFSSLAWAQGKGQIAGSVVDASTGEPLIGANIYLENTTLGAASDLDGRYAIFGVPEGNHTIVISMVGYAETKVSNLAVKENDVTKLDIPVQPEIMVTDVVVVEAKSLKNTEASLLKLRQKSESVSDAISAEEISKSGSGDAAAAMKQVTGASVVGGKYVYIRGLGERYSATTLNGAELPSADPDKKSFQLDLIPSNMLDNINTRKTFTPDKPGTFTGGLVDVTTKSYPEELSFQVSSSVGYNSISTWNDQFILTNMGGSDWLGFDDGTRDIPDLLLNEDQELPTPNNIWRINSESGDEEETMRLREEAALFLDKASKSFNNVMNPVSASAPLNSSFGISLGNTVPINDHQSIGYFGSFSWNQNTSFYDDGIIGRYKAPGQVGDLTALDTVQYFQDRRGSREINWGAIFTAAYKNTDFGQVKFSYMHTQSAEAMARFVSGYWQDLPSSTFETRVLSWTERSLNTYQLEGEHVLPLFDAKLEWKSSYSVNNQDEPDQRYFSNHYSVRERNGETQVIYQNPTSLYPQPIRYFRELEEDNYSNMLDLSFPFHQWSGMPARVKLGIGHTAINRDYRQRRFEYLRDGSNISYRDYGPDVESYFSNVGILDSSNADPGRWDYAMYITEIKSLKNYFTGEQNTLASYLMLDLPLYRDLRFVGGARLESTEMLGVSADSSQPRGVLNNDDILPSVNLIYYLGGNMNLRLAYSHTVARPTFRELAPYTTFDFAGDFIFQGNANLRRTLIRNYDLRWEWFTNPGEIVAVSGFFKSFTDPIERYLDNAQSSTDAAFGVQNVSKARVMGAEFEVRKDLGFIYTSLNGLKLGSNLSFVSSEVDIPEEELFVIRQNDPTAPGVREFIGQSPYLFNVNLTYDRYERAFSAGLYLNYFGDRLAFVTLGASPDVYERGFAQLDFKVSKGLFGKFELALSAKNLLNQDVTFSQEFKGNEFIYQQYRRGLTISTSLSYKL